MKSVAMTEFGISEDAIITDDDSHTTYENAIDVNNIIRARDLDSITLVTSAYHQRRALETFEHVLGPDVAIQNAPAPVDFWRPLTWWQDEKGRELTFSELAKIVWSAVTGKYE
jgi:uncharacterized SAM-binding protein YcdF (DUF218 family)